MNHTLSIIVVALNEEKHIARLKRAIDALDNNGSVVIETLLVDGGSADQTVSAAKHCGFSKIIVLPGANIPVCRNAGLKAATGNWIAFLDADCEPSGNWLREARPILSAAKEIIIGWPVVPPAPGTWVQNAWRIHWMHKNPRLDSWHGFPAVTHDSFRLITTRNMLMTRAAAEILGGFDENLPTGEDTDFAYRAYRGGLVVLGVPALTVIHHGEPATLREFYRQQTWHANRSSYGKIIRNRETRTGGNALRFAALFLTGSLLFIAGTGIYFVTGSPVFLLMLMPLPVLIAVPAAIIAGRARRLRCWPALCVLYAAYGFARTLDLTGFHRNKTSWKTKAQ
ncbi:MAG: glycosyltransferase [Kiritimatiellia bacterium]